MTITGKKLDFTIQDITTQLKNKLNYTTSLHEF